jgi:hypothetical protein
LAQIHEKARFQVLLRDLCKGIEEPEQVGRGRPRIPLADSIFAAKLVAHNLCCLIQAIYELGIDPVFWAELPVAQQVASN